MHLPLLKALIAVISASVLAIGVALASAGNPHQAHSLAATTKARTLETDGLQFVGQLAAGNVKPDPALKQSWIDDLTAVAHSLGLSDRALAGQLSAGRSLAQIAASRGVPTSLPRSVLLRHLRDDLHRAEQDHALSRRPQNPCSTPSARHSAAPSLPVMTQTKCRGCGAAVPDIEGAVHKYVPSAPGCWQTFGEVQADEAHRFRIRQRTGWWSTHIWHSTPATATTDETANRCSSTSSACAPCSNTTWPIPT